MLGYQIIIYRQTNEATSPAIAEAPEGARVATSQTGIGGLDWLVALAKEGKAIFLGGDGYPARWTAPPST
jgi:hypothetical protein